MDPLTMGLVGGGISLLSGLFGGGSPKAPTLEKVPSASALGEFVDYITGTRTITVKDANGKTSQRIERIQRTEAEEEEFQKLKSTVTGVMGNLRTLLDNSPNQKKRFESLISTLGELDAKRTKDMIETFGGDIPSQQRFADDLNNFKERSIEVQDDFWRRKRNAAEERLIQSGHLDSSAAHEVRANLDHQEGLARAKVSMDAEVYGSKLAQQNFDNSMVGYNALRLQNKEDYDTKEAARAKAEKLAAAGYLGKQALEKNIVEDQEKLMGHNQVFIDKEQQQVERGNSYRMSVNARNDQIATTNANNGVASANYANQVNEYQNSAGYNARKLGMNVGGNLIGQAFSLPKDKNGRSSSFFERFI